MKKSYFSFLLAIFATVVIGCGDSGIQQISGYQGPNPPPGPNPSPSPTNTPIEQIGNLRIINPTAAFTDLSVSIDGQTVSTLGDLESSGYIEVEAGTHTVTVTEGADTVVQGTVTVAEDSYTSAVILPNNLEIRVDAGPLQQTIDEEGVSLITIVDDVTPVAGEVNARLFNAFYTENEAELLTGATPRVSLLGPVEDRQTGPYETVDPADLIGVESFVVQLTDLPLPGLPNGLEVLDIGIEILFDTVQGSDQGVVEALFEEAGVSGVNLTVFTATGSQADLEVELTGDLNEQLNQKVDAYLFVLVDDPADGSRSIVSKGDISVLLPDL